MNVWYQQGQYNYQEDDFGVKQEVIEQIYQCGVNVYYCFVEEGEDQYVCGWWQLLVQLLVEVGSE